MKYAAILLIAVAGFAYASPRPNVVEYGPPTKADVKREAETTAAYSVEDAAPNVPVETEGYFEIEHSCSSDTRNIDKKLYTNRYAFYKRAMEDAKRVATAAEKWPQYGTDASDMYINKDGKAEAAPYVDTIKANIKKAAEWGPKGWFDTYIILTCSDPHSVCNNHVDGDPRPIACYVNNTHEALGFIRSEINCCAPFFQVQTIHRAWEANKDLKKEDRYLNNLMTSGSYLLHEMMHSIKITEDRKHIIDEKFENAVNRRIYGPKDVAKAARLEKIEKTSNNADTYAVWASAMYWKDILGDLYKPNPKYLAEDEDTVEDDYLVSDGSNNYPELENKSAETTKTTTTGASGSTPTTGSGDSSKSSDPAATTTTASSVVLDTSKASESAAATTTIDPGDTQTPD